MADPGKRNMWEGDESAVTREFGEGCFAHPRSQSAIDVVSDSDVRLRKLHRAHVDDVADEDDPPPIAFDCVENASGRMPWVYGRADSRRDLGSPLECLHFARVHVMFQRRKVVIEVIHSIVRFGGIRSIAKEI